MSLELYTQLSHHYLVQPRDWHGRWTVEGAVDPRIEGFPTRCYATEKYGDTSEYINNLGNVITGDLSVEDIQSQLDIIDATTQQADERAQEIQDMIDESYEPEPDETSLAEVGAAIVGAALVGTALSLGLGAAAVGATGTALGAVFFPAAGIAATDAAIAIFGTTVAAAIINQLPEMHSDQALIDQISTTFGDTFQQITSQNMSATEMRSLIQDQIATLPTSQDADVQIMSIQAERHFLAALQSYTISQHKYHNETLRTTYEQLLQDAQRLEENPDLETELFNRYSSLRDRERSECHAES